MFRFFDRPKNQITSIRRAPQDSKRFWFFLGSGSFLIHLGLIHWVGVISLRSSDITSELDGTPIDLIELPETASTQASPTQPSGELSRPVAGSMGEEQSQVQSAPTQVLPETENSSSSNIAIGPESESISSLSAQPEFGQDIADPELPTANQESTEDPANHVAVQQESIEDPTSSTEPALDPTMPSTAHSAATVPNASATSPSPTETEASPRSLPTEAESPAANHPVHVERLAAVTPSPLLSTQSIDVPIPDVSGRLPDPADPASDLAANITQQITIPSHLTASLTATSLPPQRNEILDETAQPTTKVQTFSSNSASSPCRVTPEVVRYLGKTVAMQVITNEKGRVVHTITQESSQSLAYDELATCLVKNWTFEPAIARGQPVANDGLMVHITIDRS